MLDWWFVSVIVYSLFTNKQLNWCSRNICGTWLAPNHLWDLACSPIKFGTWCAPKLYVGPGVLSSCMWGLACSQVVCGTWRAPKLYVGPKAPKLYVGPTCSQVVCGSWRAPRLYVVYSQIIVIFNWDHGVVSKIFSIGLFLVKHPTPPPHLTKHPTPAPISIYLIIWRGCNEVAEGLVYLPLGSLCKSFRQCTQHRQ